VINSYRFYLPAPMGVVEDVLMEQELVCCSAYVSLWPEPAVRGSAEMRQLSRRT
jgi:hypothetical protein